MDDIIAKATPAVVVTASLGNIQTSSEQTSTAEIITLRLCSNCEKGFHRHHYFEDVVKAAKKGCVQCIAAAKGIRLAFSENYRGIYDPAPLDGSLKLDSLYSRRTIGSYLRVSSYKPDSRIKEKTIELVQLCTSGKEQFRLPAFVQYERLPEAVASGVTFEIIRNWIKACVNRNVLPGIKGLLPFGHSRCDKNESTQLPKRVLDLQNEKVRLVEAKEGVLGKYACLSYCWGSAEFLRTLTSNFERHKKEISLEDMPLLFCDAVEVCRQLSIPYLWVDALCIIQDRDTDWAEQASKMAEIYGNSFLTIAATAAQDPRSSLLKRDPPSTEFYTIPHESHHSFKLAVRAAMEHPKRGQDRGASSYPLQRRGWVLQEDCLPPRTLHFLSGEVALVCCAGMMCECSNTDAASGDDTWEEACARFNCTSPKIFPEKRSPDGRTHVDTIQSWHSIVAMYTSTNLTRASDKLPALSGLAKAMLGDKRKDEYFAGLWKSNLKYDLLWSLSLFSSPVRKPRCYRAPSWSWASVDGSVVFQEYMEHESLVLACKVLETRCEASTIDEFGQVRDGKLVLMGKLLRGALEYEPSADRRWDDAELGRPDEELIPNEAWVKYEGVSFSFRMDHTLSEYGMNEGTELELFWLCDAGSKHLHLNDIYGLVLYQKPGYGRFRERVGLWAIDTRRRGQAFLREAFQKSSPQRVEIR